MVTKKEVEQTPSELFIKYAEGLLRAAENGEKIAVNQSQQIEKLREDVINILQRLAVMDAMAYLKKENDIIIEKEKRKGWTIIEKIAAVIAWIIGTCLFIWYVITNIQK